MEDRLERIKETPRIDYDDGSFELTSYGCCGVDSRTDRDGITTSYSYDALKRLATETRAGVTLI